MMTHKELALNLVGQMLEIAQKQDAEFKKEMNAKHQSERAIGDSWLVFHLKTLQEVIVALENPKSC